MTVAIVGCGSSAKNWGQQKFDLSIGVNDAAKWGYPLDQLVLINFPRKFTHERLRIIYSTKAKVWTHTGAWRQQFPACYVIRLTEFHKMINKDLIYCSKTSPIVAISLAVKQGAQNVVLFGVDMLTHKVYSRGSKHGDFEINKYIRFFEQLNKRGVKIFRGANGTAFDNTLPMFQ